MRAGESLVAMSQDRLRQIFAEGSPHWGEEVVREGVAAQDVVELLDTQRFFELLKLPYPTTQEGVVERLEQKRLSISRGAGHDLTRLGALLLAKQLDDFPELARRAPRVVVYKGTTKLETRLDKVERSGYAAGFRLLVSFVMAQMPRREVVVHALRREQTLVPEIVIRELVANALVHQDLALGGTSPMIEIYDDRIEISNPGEPIVDANRFIDGYQSRNEHLAELMRSFGICEEKGSGVDRVIAATEESPLPAPDFRVGHHRTHVLVFGPREFSETTLEERIRACFQHCALRWVNGGHMTNQSLRARFRLPEDKSSSVSQVIGAAVDAKLVKLDKSVGASKRHARYIPFWA
jgi:predicted HTH transcriptional regulator